MTRVIYAQYIYLMGFEFVHYFYCGKETLNTAVTGNCRLMGVMVVSSVQVHSPSPLLCAYIRGHPPQAQVHILKPRYSCLGDLSLLPLC
jgi:hypothetical protein